MTSQPTRTPPTEPGDWEFTLSEPSKEMPYVAAGDAVRIAINHAMYCRWQHHGGHYAAHLQDMPPGYWRRAEPLAPFAPQLPVVELWEGEIAGSKRYMIVEGRHFIAVDDEGYCMNDGNWDEYKDDYTNVRRTHACKWEPCDE